MADLVLSLFPGIGLLDRAFEEEGFCVVRGPDLLWGGDVRRFHPPAGRFDGVIGGPPCQCFSSMGNLARRTVESVGENLIPEFERCVAQAWPGWFVMENVRAAPLPVVDGYAVSSVLVNNREFGAEQNRERRFAFGLRGARAVDLWRWLEVVALVSPVVERTVLASGPWSEKTRVRPTKDGRMREFHYRNSPSRASVAKALRLQGLPEDFFGRSPLTVEGQYHVLGNGVPLPMGRAVAAAVRRALESEGS